MSKSHAKYAGVALLGLFSLMPVVHADEAVSKNDTAPIAEETTSPEHGKINTPDASPVDPGHVEIESSYTYTHANRFWDNDGKVQTRELLREQALGLSLTAGVFENFDVTVGGSYVWLKYKDNSFDTADAELGP